MNISELNKLIEKEKRKDNIKVPTIIIRNIILSILRMKKKKLEDYKLKQRPKQIKEQKEVLEE